VRKQSGYIGGRLTLFQAKGQLWLLASGFERQPVSAETMRLLQTVRAAFDQIDLARAEIEVAQAARKARRRAQRSARV